MYVEEVRVAPLLGNRLEAEINLVVVFIIVVPMSLVQQCCIGREQESFVLQTGLICRNIPELDMYSDLSDWLSTNQLSSQRERDACQT